MLEKEYLWLLRGFTGKDRNIDKSFLNFKTPLEEEEEGHKSAS